MKTIKKITKQIFSGILVMGLAMNFVACNQQLPLESNRAQDAFLTKKGRLSQQTSNSIVQPSDGSNFLGYSVESGTMIARYNKRSDSYRGGKIMLSQGSQFEILDNSLIPPSELHGEDVTITMTLTTDEANNQMVFEFGPHGSQFNPAATVRLHYNGVNPKLFYIEEDGTYVEQQPDDVNTENKWLVLTIEHFSRYAVAWSE